MLNRRNFLAVVTMTIAGFTAATAEAAVPYVDGTFQTPNKSGKITFRPQRAIAGIGYEGTFVVGGKSFPGSLYGFRDGSGRVGMVWYYGTSGLQAGNAVVGPAVNGKYPGTVTFTDRGGNVTDSGSATVTITYK